MNGYDLSRNFCNWAFENPDKVKPIHYAIFYFAIEHCNRLGWKDKFGLPSQMVMEAIGVKNWRTYAAGLHELVEFGFIEMVEISKNQYSSNIIAIVKNTKAPTKALDKALSKHSTKHSQSTVSIVKQETINNKPTLEEFVAYGIQQLPEVNTEALRLKYSSWVETNWCVLVGGKTRPIKNWKSTLNNTLPYLPKMIIQPIDPLVVEMKRQRQMYGLE